MIRYVDENIRESVSLLIRDNFDIYLKIYKQLTIEQIFSPGVIKEFAYLTAKGFWQRKDTQVFMRSVDRKCDELSKSVINGTFVPRYYQKKKILERGKIREIEPPFFDSKMVQKILSETILRPVLENEMVAQSYATVRNRGTDNMYTDIVKGLNEALNRGYKYIVLGDEKDYFNSIDIRKLKEICFDPYIPQERVVALLMLFYPREVGLLLGNEVSQLPATFFLTPVDKSLSDITPFAYRYMDDMMAAARNKKEAKDLKTIMQEGSSRLNLSVPDEKSRIIRMGADFVFCKERFYYSKSSHQYYQMINSKRISTENRKIKTLDGYELKMQFDSVIGTFRTHPNCKKITAELKRRYQTKMENTGHIEPKTPRDFRVAYPNTVIFTKGGIFFHCWDDDAFIVHGLTDYKIHVRGKGRYTLGFSEGTAEEKVKELLQANAISYIFIIKNRDTGKYEIVNKNDGRPDAYESLTDSGKQYYLKNQTDNGTMKRDPRYYKALDMLDNMANGRHPVTGNKTDTISLNDPEIIRVMFMIKESLA